MKPNEQLIHTNVKSTKPYYIVMKTILQYCTVLYSYCTIVYCTVVCAQKHLRGTASQPAKQPAGRPKTKPIQKHQAAGRLAGRPAKTQTESGRPAGRGPYTRLAGRLAELNTDWPAGRARNSRTSSPHSLCFSNVFHIFSATLFSEFSQWKLNFTSMIFDKCSFHILSAIFIF